MMVLRCHGKICVKQRIYWKEIDGDLYEIIQYAEKIESVIEDLRKAMPEFDDDEFDKNEDTGT